MNVYAHVTLDDKRQALDRFGDLLGDAQSSRWCQRGVSVGET